MIIDSYEKLQSALLSGQVDACTAFLASRHDSDKGQAEYWYWQAQMYYRSGRLLRALDICFMLTREAGAFGMHFHCLADICAHLGTKEIGLAVLEMLASKAELSRESSYYVRLSGSHYVGEDDRALSIHPGHAVQPSCMSEHIRARSLMRRRGIPAGIHVFHQTYCSQQAVAELWPVQDVERYWCGQQHELPKQLTIKGFSCGFGDFIQWIRYARALKTIGVEIGWDVQFDGLLGDCSLNDQDHQSAQQLKLADFVYGRSDAHMWTTPFTLFLSLFPVLGYGSTSRHIESRNDQQVEQQLSEIRKRAQGRRCVGIFWSSCESNDLYARKSLRHGHLDPLRRPRATSIGWSCRVDTNECAGPMGRTRKTLKAAPFCRSTLALRK
ncbi:putative tPR repeat protein [Ralstonia insidiosa]|uniref:TPR repeat protein n=1 Tax=Ralstonia insidiosa TaxID=190721 RepID=A0AAC9BLN4_9RALS|nr:MULTISPECIES: hypothetical protein [Ralstonia]ANH76305.1 putative tPR repeat protein [Ralstonia insidiosa]EPX98605.1 hypothetical protein C404_06800 [Ralstonia sp. AU12-08]